MAASPLGSGELERRWVDGASLVEFESLGAVELTDFLFDDEAMGPGLGSPTR